MPKNNINELKNYHVVFTYTMTFKAKDENSAMLQAGQQLANISNNQRPIYHRLKLSKIEEFEYGKKNIN